MACYHPLQVWRSRTKNKRGNPGITFDQKKSTGQRAQLPCGQCIGCRIDRTRSWTTRIIHEAQLHESNSFITLTYAPEHIPEDHGLRKRDFQLFMKRLRKSFPQKIRYYMCGEYGEKLGRPHYHAILFNIDFKDKYLCKTQRGNKIYRSPKLEELWPLGSSEIGSVTEKSAAYVARYVMKKVNGDMAKDHYEKTDPETGEIYKVIPEYNQMSLRPGLGHDWYKKYKTDVYPKDEIILSSGKRATPPKYYDKLLERTDPEIYWIIKDTRQAVAQASTDNTPERLAAREKCALARNKTLKRELK